MSNPARSGIGQPLVRPRARPEVNRKVDAGLIEHLTQAHAVVHPELKQRRITGIRRHQPRNDEPQHVHRLDAKPLLQIPLDRFLRLARAAAERAAKHTGALVLSAQLIELLRSALSCNLEQLAQPVCARRRIHSPRDLG